MREDIECPICGSTLISQRYIMECSNRCYSVIRTGWTRIEIVFNERFEVAMEDDPIRARSVEDKLKEKIAYWKENDRYLMRILEN